MTGGATSDEKATGGATRDEKETGGATWDVIVTGSATGTGQTATETFGNSLVSRALDNRQHYFSRHRHSATVSFRAPWTIATTNFLNRLG